MSFGRHQMDYTKTESLVWSPAMAIIHFGILYSLFIAAVIKVDSLGCMLLEARTPNTPTHKLWCSDSIAKAIQMRSGRHKTHLTATQMLNSNLELKLKSIDVDPKTILNFNMFIIVGLHSGKLLSASSRSSGYSLLLCSVWQIVR